MQCITTLYYIADIRRVETDPIAMLRKSLIYVPMSHGLHCTSHGLHHVTVSHGLHYMLILWPHYACPRPCPMAPTLHMPRASTTCPCKAMSHGLYHMSHGLHYMSMSHGLQYMSWPPQPYGLHYMPMALTTSPHCQKFQISIDNSG